MKLVIAHYNEDLKWLSRVPSHHEIIVLEKERFMPNLGRDVASHFLYMLQNWQTMEGNYIFCQGDPFWHHPWFVADIGTRNYWGWNLLVENDGSNYWTDMSRFEQYPMMLHTMCERLGIPMVSNWCFRQGCQFAITGDQVRQLSYERMCEALAISVLPEGPYGLEIMYPMLFPHLINDLRDRTQTTPSRRPQDLQIQFPDEFLDEMETAAIARTGRRLL